MSLGKRISYLRTEKGLTQEKLADIIGISRGSLSMYEIDKREPDNATLKKIADYFNVSTDYLLGRSSIRNAEAGSVPPPQTEGLYEGLPPQAIEELKEFKEYIKYKYSKKKCKQRDNPLA